ncbi:transposase [Oceanobacter sp. 5_MG-2023]|uniref:transposase n=1 Tax=Oceanobacter sp. 5_MG-2023 TaxID=3062645 RepID=UPI0026E322D7|nr:transposase [Oceanobacter sp. 5_MG-2023]MDO6682212.1 transposase [Oceanobacter sp. 5_MG-2023]
MSTLCITPVFYKEAEKLDLSVFHQPYKNDQEGRPAYDPAILLKISLFAYSKGITSSREIQWCCETNILFKALSCDTVPHFTTFAYFVSSQPQAMNSLPLMAVKCVVVFNPVAHIAAFKQSVY